MQIAVIAVFLLILIGMFAGPVQDVLRRWFHKDPKRVWAVPLALTAFFGAGLWAKDALNPLFLAMVLVYTAVPTALVSFSRRTGRTLVWTDLAAVFLMWLPVEFTIGKDLLPQRAYGVAVVLSHGTAVALALFLFLIFRNLPGMKYNPPQRWKDLVNPVIGFAVALPILLYLGLKLDFMGAFRVLPSTTPALFGKTFAITLAAVAIPEELLFRALIQNWLMQRFGSTNRVLLIAAVIFGAAHLDNPPGPLPNWRYMILASIAGFIYGKVFQKSTTVLSSASLHALVNTIRHLFFA